MVARPIQVVSTRTGDYMPRRRNRGCCTNSRSRATSQRLLIGLVAVFRWENCLQHVPTAAQRATPKPCDQLLELWQLRRVREEVDALALARGLGLGNKDLALLALLLLLLAG